MTMRRLSSETYEIKGTRMMVTLFGQGGKPDDDVQIMLHGTVGVSFYVPVELCARLAELLRQIAEIAAEADAA